MTNKLSLVTGATSGIGYITALELARKGSAVILHGRNEQKLKRTRNQIHNDTNNDHIYLLQADFFSLEQVQKAADQINQDYKVIDVLVNNAGLIFGSERHTSPDGFELTIAINHLAPFAFTKLIFDRIAAAREGRIINVASEAHLAAAPDFEDFNMEQSYAGFRAYANSKLYNIMFTKELAGRLSNYPNVTTYSLHPGTVATNFSASAGGLTNFAFKLMRPFLTSAKKGAQTNIYLASASDIPANSGSYFINQKPAKVKHKFYTEENNAKLWEISEILTGEPFLSEAEKVSK